MNAVNQFKLVKLVKGLLLSGVLIAQVAEAALDIVTFENVEDPGFLTEFQNDAWNRIDSSASSRWVIEPKSDGTNAIFNDVSGLYLANAGGNVSLAAGDTSDNTRWAFQQVSNSVYLINKATNFALDSDGRNVRVDADTDGVYDEDDEWVITVVGQRNDDPSLSISDAIVKENDGSVVVTVELSEASDDTVDVTVVTRDGTALMGIDYFGIAQPLSFAPGETSKTVNVTILDDLAIESDKTFTVNLVRASGAEILDGEGVVTIEDNDNGTNPVLSVSDIAVSESAGMADVAITLSPAATQAVTVSVFTRDDSATSGTDYYGKLQVVSFAPGETSKTFSVTILDDSDTETEEAFSVFLTQPVGADIADNTGVVTIQDNDDGSNPALTIADVNVNESESRADILITLAPESTETVGVTVFTRDGTASQGSDYFGSRAELVFAPGETSKTFSIDILDDSAVESAEVFTARLVRPSNAEIERAVAEVTIEDNDSGAAELSVSDATVNESAGTVSVEILLSSISAQTVDVVAFTRADTAVAGSDFFGKTETVVFQPGETKKSFDIDIVNDNQVESEESFFVKIINPSNANIADDEANVTITDDDSGSNPQLSVADLQVNESDGTASVVVSLSGTTDQQIQVTAFTRSGSATPGADNDFFGTSQLLTFAAGEDSMTISVVILDDETIEDTEEFFVILSNPSNATILDAEGTVTILDDDGGTTATFSVADVTIVEGDELSIPVRLNQAQSMSVEVTAFTQAGTAEGGGLDFQGKTDRLVFAAGVTEIQFVVSVADDVLIEDDETFTIKLSDPVGATIGDGEGVVTIQDNDTGGVAPVLSISDVSVTEGESALLEIFLDRVSTTEIQVTVSTRAGTAEGGGVDYIGSTQRITFAPGDTAMQFAVPTTDDQTAEDLEIFTVRLTNPVGAGIADGIGEVAVVDND